MATSNEDLTVWVGGLDGQVTNEILWELFLQAGPLLDVKLPVDRETGEQRPFAFIAFKHPESGPYAERLFNGIKLFDKIIRVRYKGQGKFDQNQYSELYEQLLERLVKENPDKYANIFEEIATVKAGYNQPQSFQHEEDHNEHFAGHPGQYHHNVHNYHNNNVHQRLGGGGHNNSYDNAYNDYNSDRRQPQRRSYGGHEQRERSRDRSKPNGRYSGGHEDRPRNRGSQY